MLESKYILINPVSDRVAVCVLSVSCGFFKRNFHKFDAQSCVLNLPQTDRFLFHPSIFGLLGRQGQVFEWSPT